MSDEEVMSDEEPAGPFIIRTPDDAEAALNDIWDHQREHCESLVAIQRELARLNSVFNKLRDLVLETLNAQDAYIEKVLKEHTTETFEHVRQTMELLQTLENKNELQGKLHSSTE